MDETKVCPKCGGQMIMGSIAGHVSAGWFKGDLSKNKLFQQVERKDLHAFACQKCGFTEIYTLLNK